MARKDISDVQVLQAYVDARACGYRTAGAYVWPEDLLMASTGQPLKVCRAAMWRAVDRDLIEYGVSMRSGWLTAKGEALLAGYCLVAEECAKLCDAEINNECILLSNPPQSAAARNAASAIRAKFKATP